MKYLNKNFKNYAANLILRKFYKQKQKVNNSNKYSIEEKKMVMKGIDMCINTIWDIEELELYSHLFKNVK